MNKATLGNVAERTVRASTTDIVVSCTAFRYLPRVDAAAAQHER